MWNVLERTLGPVLADPTGDCAVDRSLVGLAVSPEASVAQLIPLSVAVRFIDADGQAGALNSVRQMQDTVLGPPLLLCSLSRVVGGHLMVAEQIVAALEIQKQFADNRMPFANRKFFLAKQILEHQAVLPANHVEIIALEQLLLVQFARLGRAQVSAPLRKVFVAEVQVDYFGELAKVLGVQEVRLAARRELDVAH